MLKLAQICLMAQIILAPLMLGGARPWALAVLAILTGTGILAVCMRPGPVRAAGYLRHAWLFLGALIVWCLIQSLPIWPIQSDPFKAPMIALMPDGWMDTAIYLVWLGGLVTLTSLIGQACGQHLVNLAACAIVISCALQVALAATSALFDWNTTFWFAKQTHLGDWTGSFANRNAFGALMGFGVLACLFFYDHSPAQSVGKRLDRSGGWLALAILFAAALIQSHSRLAFVMMLVGVMVFGLLRTAPYASFSKRMIFVCLGGTLVIGLATLISPELFARFYDLSRADLIQRDDLWQTAVLAITDRPITGFGPDSITLVLGHFATPMLNTHANWFSSHNLWLDGAIMFGVPVMLGIGLALSAAIKIVLRTCLHTANRALLIALFAMTLPGTFGDWVMIMPALTLPVVMLMVASFEAGLAEQATRPEYGDHAAQSPAPDQATLH